MDRRTFLRAGSGILMPLVAPAICRAEWLMPARSIRISGEKGDEFAQFEAKLMAALSKQLNLTVFELSQQFSATSYSSALQMLEIVKTSQHNAASPTACRFDSHLTT